MLTMPRLDIFSNSNCNFNCANCAVFCHKGEQETIQNIEELLEPINYLQKYARIEWAFIYGGEPTLHPDIENFIKKLRHNLIGTKLELISNGWWMPDEDKFGSLWSLIDKLGQGIHPELLCRMTLKEIRECMTRIRNKYKIFTNLYIDEFFAAPIFTDVPNNNIPCCRFGICTTLLPTGKLSRCSILCKVPSYLASNIFVQTREDSYFDIYKGSAYSLEKWLNTTPVCCQYCTGNMILVPHFGIITDLLDVPPPIQECFAP